jgi:hypothetical protein
MHHRDSHQGNRRLVHAIKPIVETLEKRQLLAGDVFNVSKLPVFTPTSGDIGDFKSGPLGNAGATLGQLYVDYKRFIKKDGTPAHYQPILADQLFFKGQQVAVTVRARGTIEEVSQIIRDAGGQLVYRGKALRAIDALVPISQLTTLSTNPKVATISAIFKPATQSQGNAHNQAEEGQNVDSLRSTFNLTGDGVKIGVLSDSVNQVGHGLADSYDSGDLPPPSEIDVLSDGTDGTDEGRAMLELIHDVAPKSSLAFAAGLVSQQVFAANVYALYEAGCDVIVDDLLYRDEPIFQEGVIAQAITSVTAKGVVYASSAGNASTSGYQTRANWVTGSDGRIYMDWDPDPNHVDTLLRIDTSTAGSFQLGWDEAYNGVVGAAVTDLDVNVINPATGAHFPQYTLPDNPRYPGRDGHTNNLATGLPIETVLAPGGFVDIEVVVAQRTDGKPLPSRIGFFSIHTMPDSFANAEYKPDHQSSVGSHNAAADAITVAAVPFWESPAYDNDGLIETEDFTSYGPKQNLFYMNGTRRPQTQILAKPDLSGVQNTNTSFFGEDVPNDPDKQLNFSGTSAAAPSVAGTAALLIQLAKNQSISYTPASIRNALIESAKLNPTNGAQSGEWDRRGGYGLVDGVAAARILVPDIPSPDIQRVVPFDSPRGIDSLTIQFNEPVTGFDISDLILTRKGVSVFDGNQTLTTDDNQTFVLNGLKKITNRRGTYKLVLDGASITDSDGNVSLGATELFYVSGKPTNVVVTAIAPDELNVTWYDNAVAEQGYRVYRSLNASFSDAKVFDLPPDTEKFRDTGLVPATQYYYKVLPVYQDIEIVSSPSATQNGFTLAENEIVLDNLSSKGVEVVGDWRSTSDGNKWGLNYLDDKGEGKGDKSVTFTPNIKEKGEYLVYIRWVANDKNATKVPVTVKDGNGVKQTTTVNQRQNTTWKLIGKFVLAEGRKNYVQINTLGTTGRVVADAARFVKADNGGPDPIDPGTGF